MNNEYLMEKTAPMPMKQIDVNGAPYLQRYYAGTLEDDSDLWLHRFMSCDGERHLHSHPFEARSVILTGWYLEELPDNQVVRRQPGSAREVGRVQAAIEYGAGRVDVGAVGRLITPFDWHRISEVGPDTWTAFIVRPERLPMWFFRDDDGNLEPVCSSDRYWWRKAGTRP